MANPINGRRGANLQPRKYGKNESGRYLMYRWEGTRAEIQQLIPGLDLGGAYYEVQEGFTGAKDSLEARFPTDPSAGGNDVVNTWEFFAQTVEKDLLDSNNAAAAGISKDDKTLLREAVQNWTHAASPQAVFGTSPNLLELYNLMLDGVRAVRVQVPTLRNTATV